jgi:hypothetical protein
LLVLVVLVVDWVGREEKGEGKGRVV